MSLWEWIMVSRISLKMRTIPMSWCASLMSACINASMLTADDPLKLPRRAPQSLTPRKAERVSMTGTNAYAVLGEQGARRARVLDLGFGGVALELDSSEGLTENILAVVHVPRLPPVRVNLKPVWSQRTNLGYRVGCTFVN